MSERVVITSQPIDSRHRVKYTDEEFVVFMSGFIVGFVVALLLGVMFLSFAEIWSTQAEQPLSPFGEDGFWRPQNERVPKTPENFRSR